MTTESAALSSVWCSDGKTEEFLTEHGRGDAYREMAPETGAYYDGLIEIDLSSVECMIALPFHPSKAYTIHELQKDPQGIFAKIEEDCNKQLGGKVKMDLQHTIVDGKVTCDQGIIVGCSGGMYENIVEAAAILKDQSIGNGYFDMSVYASSTPINLAITKNGTAATLMEAGAVMKPSFCGPCFGAGDVPANNGLSLRHTTRNFPNREGSKPGEGQFAAVCLMDARSIAATAANGVSGYFRVDWFTPDGLRNWGDGRTFITGTDGYIELRKFIDLAAGEKRENMVYWANRQGEFSTNATGKVGCPFFGRLIRDCIDRTETAMTQAHAFRAAELCLKAQQMADQ